MNKTLLKSYRNRSSKRKPTLSFLFVLLCSLLCVNTARSQVSSGYIWSQSQQTYIPGISTTSTTPSDIFSTFWDDNTYTAYTFPFNFTYNGVLYTAGVGTIGVDSDGWVAFSTGAITMTGSTGGGSWVSISDHTGVYLNGTANNNGFCGFNSDVEEQVFADLTGNSTNGSPTITAVSDFSNIKIGTRLSGTGITNGTVVNDFNIAAQTITMSGNATATGNTTITPRSGVYAFIRGTAPYRQYVIQWTRVSRYSAVTGDDFTFQLVLNEGGGVATYQTLQAVYGTVTTANAVQNAQVGLRGNTSADFNARTTTTNWAGTTAAGANTATCSLSSTVFPTSGYTYTWSPPCAVAATNAGAISGNISVCPNTSEVYTIAGVPGAIFYTWTYTGGGTTYSGTTTLPTNTLIFSSVATGGTLTVTPGNLCGNGTSANIAITVNSVTPATISYPSATYCQSTVGTISPTLTGPGGGAYTASPSGLTITSSGVITPSTSTAGTYTVTYTFTSGVCSQTTTTTVTISPNPVVSVTATPSLLCTGGNSQLSASADAGGNYTVASIVYASLAPTGPTTELWGATYGDENVSAAIPIPFAFNYYGQNITQFFAYVNGYITLQSGYVSEDIPQALPNPAAPNNVIALAWDDLEVDNLFFPGAYVRYFVNGTAPNRIMVIDYNKLDFFWPFAGNVTGQIRLYESDNHIEVAVTTVNDAGDLSFKTLGIENSLGTVGITPAGRNNAVWNVSSEAWSFTPKPVSYLWTPATFLSSTTINNPVATAVTSTTVYNVKVTDMATGCFVNGTTTVTVGSPLSGIKTVGIGGDYATLTAAVSAYNGLCLGGPLTFSLIDNTYPSETFPIVINSNAFASSTNTLTIKPATGKTPLITGSSSGALIQLNGADYIIFDGSNTLGGTTRDLSITNTAASANTVMWITSASAANGATNNTLKNCNIYGSSSAGTIATILTGSSVTAGNDAEFPNSNNTIQNNLLYRAQNGVYQRGNTASLDQNWLITQNNIGSATVADKMSFRGIAVINSQNFEVSKNIISGINSSFTVTMSGISCFLNINTGTITQNKVTDIKNTNIYGSNGIYAGATTTASNLTIANNFIFDIASAGFNGFTSADNGYGIVLDGGGGYKVYYNTVVLNTNPSTSTTNHRAAAILVSSGITTAASVDMRNNIFANTQTAGNANSRYAILSTAANTVYSNTDYNEYLSSGSTNLLCKGSNATTYTTIALLRTNLGSNLNSINVVPTFVSTTDYHLQSVAGNSVISNLATPIAGITNDYDPQTRNGLIPDMGADEFVMPNYGSWVGKTSTDWLVPTNWEANYVPDLTTDVSITGGYAFMPTILTTQAVRTLNLSAPGTPPLLTINGGILQVYALINRTGGTIDGINGTLEMKGSAAQTIPASLFVTNRLRNLIISNTNVVTGVTLGGTLDIDSSVTFGAGGRILTTADFLTFKSSSTITAYLGQMVGTNSIVGKATIERYIPLHFKAWQLLSTPITAGSTQTVNQAWQEGSVVPNDNLASGFGTQLTSNITGAATRPTPGFDVYTPTGPSIKVFNHSTGGYTGLTHTDTAISNPKGYMVFVRGNRTVTTSGAASTVTVMRTKGTLHTPANPPVTMNITTPGFESIGNPYASAINYRLLTLTGGVQTDFFYIWDPKLTTGPTSAWGLGGFQTFSWTGSTFTVTPGGGSYASTTDRSIQSGQAFFVNAPFAAGSVGFSEGCKVTSSFNANRPSPSATKQLRTNLNVILAGEGILLDGNMVQFDRSWSNAVDIKDAVKINNMGESLGLLRTGKTLAVERHAALQKTDTIFYKLGEMKVQQYELEFIPENLQQSSLDAFLVDRYLHTYTSVSLHHPTTIRFDVVNDEASYAPNRFYLVFKKPKNQHPVPTSNIIVLANTKKTAGESKLKNVVDKSAINVYPNPVEHRKIQLQFIQQTAGTYYLQLSNDLGQQVYTASLNVNSENVIRVVQLDPGITTGVYQLTITAADGIKTTKQIIIQ